jgi:hypothetical protein
MLRKELLLVVTIGVLSSCGQSTPTAPKDSATNIVVTGPQLREGLEGAGLVPQFDLVNLVDLSIAGLGVLDDNLEASECRALFGRQLAGLLQTALGIPERPRVYQRQPSEFLEHTGGTQFRGFQLLRLAGMSCNCCSRSSRSGFAESRAGSNNAPP